MFGFGFGFGLGLELDLLVELGDLCRELGLARLVRGRGRVRVEG